MDETNITLAVLIVVFAIGLVAVDKTFQGEGEVFQVFANLLSGLVAALLARITPPKAQDALNSALANMAQTVKGAVTPGAGAPPADTRLGMAPLPPKETPPPTAPTSPPAAPTPPGSAKP